MRLACLACDIHVRFVLTGRMVDWTNWTGQLINEGKSQIFNGSHPGIGQLGVSFCLLMGGIFCTSTPMNDGQESGCYILM